MPDPISSRAVALNQVQINSAPITAPEVSQTGLGTLLSGEGGSVEFSDSGANGAILVKMPGASSGGAAIKLEGSIVGQRVEKVSSLMEDFFSNAKGPAPFVAPRVAKISSKNLDQNPEALGKISKLLEQQRTNENAFRIDKFSKKLNEVPEGESDVMVMELAKGRQISRLSTDDKLALYKSDQFARSLGSSMPVMMSLRLVDHLGSGDPMCFKNNVSNLMFDVGTGQMSVIDFDTGFQQSRVDEKLHRIGPPPGGFNPAGMVGDLNRFVTESCSSPEKFQEAVDKLVRGEDTPLKNLMDTFTDDRDQEQTLFNRLESEQVKGTLTLEDKRRFAANLLIGVVDGMEYMQKNEEALRTAVTNSHELVEIGNGVVKVEHFYNEKELHDYCEQVRNLETNTLKQKVRDLAMGAPQMRMDSLARDMEDRNRRVAEIQERLNHLDGKLIKTGGVRDEIQNLLEERVRLSKELEGCKQELNDIINREEITKVMTSQKPMLPGEELDLPRVPSVRERLKSESSNRLDQEIGEKLHVVEELPGEKLEENPRVEDLDKVDEGVKLSDEIENQPPTVAKTLTEQEQQKLQSLTAQIGQIEQGLEAVKSMPRKVAALSKLDTRGKAPDFSTFSDQELRDIFDLASKANDLNKIDSVDHNHKFSTLKVYEDKLTSENLSREELEEFVTTILAVQNNHIPPGDLVTAQTLLMGSADRGFSGWVDNVRFDYNELRKQVEERNGPNSLDGGGLGNRINTVRPEVKKIAGEHSEMANVYGRQAPRVTLEALGQQGATAREVADKIEEMTVRMGGKEKTDLRGIDLTGVDLSESDLSEAIMDVPTLARAGGLDTVRGVDPEILKNAKDFARLTTEQERLKDKLSALQKPWSFERFKAFFKPGGAEGAMRDLKNRIEQTTFDLINADPGRKERMQKLDEARSLQELGNTLKSPALSEAFSKFARSESNGASVSFLRELEDLKQELSSGVELGDLKVHVFGIQQRYLANPAETPVRLDDETRDLINQAIDGGFDELDKEKIGKLFNKAEEEISVSLAQGTLQRFKQTEEFRNLNQLDGQKPPKVGEEVGMNQPLKVSQSKVRPRVH